MDENIPDWKSAGRGERFGEKNGTIKLLLCFDLGISDRGGDVCVARLSRRGRGSNMNWICPREVARMGELEGGESGKGRGGRVREERREKARQSG